MSSASGQNSLTPQGEQNQGNNNLNFRLTHDQVVLLETSANLCPPASSKRFFTVCFSIFELGSITKHLMTGSGNSEVPLEPVIKCLLLSKQLSC